MSALPYDPLRPVRPYLAILFVGFVGYFGVGAVELHSRMQSCLCGASMGLVFASLIYWWGAYAADKLQEAWSLADDCLQSARKNNALCKDACELNSVLIPHVTYDGLLAYAKHAHQRGRLHPDAVALLRKTGFIPAEDVEL